MSWDYYLKGDYVIKVKVKKHRIFFWILLLIPLLYFIIFRLVVIPYGIYISFTNRALIGPQAREWSFVGLENYIKILKDPSFYAAIRNSFIYAVICGLIGQLWLGLFLGQLIWHGKISGGFKERVTTLIYALAILTWIMPETIAGIEMRAMFGRRGLINKLLEALRIGGVDWLNLYNTWLGIPVILWMLILANIWKGCSFSMALTLAAMEGIPREIYDAAKIDGVNVIQEFFYITLPLLKNLLPFMVIVLFTGSFSHFTFLWIILGGGAGVWKEANIAIYSYVVAFINYQVGYGAAISVITMAIYIILGVLSLKVRG